MATTTNYGWTTPDDTALVKDGAAAIRSLGSSIDTSLNTALGTKKAGLVLLNTTSFSAVATQSINNVFSSTYTNYRIVFNLSNGQGSVTMKLRASGTDTTTNYKSYTLYGVSGSMYQSAVDALGTDEFYLFDVDTGIDASGNGVMDICNPNVAIDTSITSQFTGGSGGSLYWYQTFGRQASTTQFDGFTLGGSLSTNLTGSVAIYGYNK